MSFLLGCRNLVLALLGCNFLHLSLNITMIYYVEICGNKNVLNAYRLHVLLFAVSLVQTASCMFGLYDLTVVCARQVLGTVATVLFQDHEIRHTEFQQLPYQRIFIILLIELNQPEPVLEAINFQVLQTFRYYIKLH